MNQDEALGLFVDEADRLSETHFRLEDTLLLLASLLADSTEQLSKDGFDRLVQIGGAIHKTCASRTRARSEIATTMKQSLDAEANTL